MASVLLESGAKVNATNKIGQTALIYAVITVIITVIAVISFDWKLLRISKLQ